MLLLVLACVCTATGCRLTRFTADGGSSTAVDFYNSTSGIWSTARLSVGRHYMAAACVGNVAIFAGGQSSNSRFANSYFLYFVFVLLGLCLGYMLGWCFHVAFGFFSLVFAMQQIAVS